jgi:hypothetical protein
VDHIEIANRAGVTLGDLDYLMAGHVSANVAERLGVYIGDVEDFIRGSATANMTKCLGLGTISAAEELAKCGSGVATGILIGLLLER